jgi:hypothetical protein
MKHRVLVISFLGLILSVPLLAETRGQTVVGQIVFEHNSMVCSSCEVQLETMEMRVVAKQTVGMNGRFVFDNVAPDSYLIRVKRTVPGADPLARRAAQWTVTKRLDRVPELRAISLAYGASER